MSVFTFDYGDSDTSESPVPASDSTDTPAVEPVDGSGRVATLELGGTSIFHSTLGRGMRESTASSVAPPVVGNLGRQLANAARIQAGGGIGGGGGGVGGAPFPGPPILAQEPDDDDDWDEDGEDDPDGYSRAMRAMRPKSNPQLNLISTFTSTDAASGLRPSLSTTVQSSAAATTVLTMATAGSSAGASQTSGTSTPIPIGDVRSPPARHMFPVNAAATTTTTSPIVEASVEPYAFGTPHEIIVPIRDVDFVSPYILADEDAVLEDAIVDEYASRDSMAMSLDRSPEDDLFPSSFATAASMSHRSPPSQLSGGGNVQGRLPPSHTRSTVNTFRPRSRSTLTRAKVGKPDFDLLRVIGKGAYGKVFLVRKNSGTDRGRFYAMKVLEKAHIVLHQKDTEHTRTERTILEEVRHPFIVKLFYAFQTDAKLYLILEYASGGELFTYLEKEKMLLEDKAVFYMAELVLAIEHLHKLGIIYRDLKPENVLLDRDGHVLLTDFGLSKFSLEDDRANTVCGTVEYMAPEVLANMEYEKAVDWWSLGALSFDIMTGSPPFTANNRKKTIDLIMNKKLSIPYFLSQDARDLLTKLMRKKPTVRLGYGSTDAQPIKSHRFFKQIDWPKLFNREYVPPIQPTVNAPDDVGNFHSAFTSMPVVDSPPGEGMMSKEKEPSDVFSGFSFVASCVLHETKFEELYTRNRRSSASDGTSGTSGIGGGVAASTSFGTPMSPIHETGAHYGAG